MSAPASPPPLPVFTSSPLLLEEDDQDLIPMPPLLPTIIEEIYPLRDDEQSLLYPLPLPKASAYPFFPNLAARSKWLRSAWREATRGPTAGLGRWCIGQSEAQMNPSSANRLVREMLYCPMPSSGRSDGWGDGDSLWMSFLDCSFLDLGSGNGLVCAASIVFGSFTRSLGIEIDENQVHWAHRRITKNVPNVSFLSGDILNWTYSSDEFTHVLSFDKEYPPKILFHILEQMTTNVGCWCVWATARNLDWWHGFLSEYVYGWQAHEGSVQCNRARSVIEGLSRIEQIKRVGVNLCISNEGHSLYLMRCFK